MFFLVFNGWFSLATYFAGTWNHWEKVLAQWISIQEPAPRSYFLLVDFNGTFVTDFDTSPQVGWEPVQFERIHGLATTAGAPSELTDSGVKRRIDFHEGA